LVDAIKKTPVVLYDYKVSNKITPSTVVLSDPNFDNGNGERIFINSIGAAWDFTPDDLDEDFFKSDLVIFGGTALVPGIHDNLTELLKKAKQNRGITIVNTVFDFRNDKQNPYKKWPLGKSSKSYQYIDLLIADKEEALRLSGKKTIETAITYFLTNKVLAVVITNGINPIWAYSNGKLFEQINLTKFPVSQSILDELKTNTQGDTTGAGDNFAGGIIASIISQLQQNHKILNLTDAITWGIVSGGFACFYMGGAYFENERFEKLKLVKSYYDAYQLQING
jgi:sugar/nucleoside kinase (ribokinase family)